MGFPTGETMSKKLRYGCLFSGIGAPLQGAYRVYGKENVEHIFSCEFDKYARQSFQANYEIEEKNFHIDVNDMDGKQYKDKVDIIIGGSPCQDFSIAGLRAGIDGHRGQLIWQYYRIIMEAQPEIFIYENVKGMVSDKGGKTLNDFLHIFRESGYYCHHAVLNTKDYGVPQNRERIYIVGFKDHELYHRFQFAPKIKLEKRLKDVLESDVDEKYYLSEKLIAGFMAHEKNMKAKGNGFAFKPTLGDTCGFAITDPAKNRIDDNYIKVKSATNSGYETATTGDSINLTHPDSKTRRGRVGVGVAQTLDCACNQAVVTERIRKLTPRECLRLQDFPDTSKYEEIVSNSQAYKQAGNSMSVNILEMIFSQIEKAKAQEPTNTLMDFLHD